MEGSHVLLFDLNDSSSFSLGHTSLCSHQEGDNKVKSKTTHDRDLDQDEAYKWMPSKMRILRRMMMSSCQESSQKLEDQKKFSSTTFNHHPAANSSPKPTYDDMMDHSARVCADCNTTKTPLWRSGPRGPKSLCNACGIRQRKARRAMAAAAAAASGSILGVSAAAAPPLKIKKLKKKKKKKRSKGGLHDNNQLKKTHEIKAISHKSSNKELVDGLEDLRSRVVLSSKYYNAKVFPQDEKEAAILLMALSSGILSN